MDRWHAMKVFVRVAEGGGFAEPLFLPLFRNFCESQPFGNRELMQVNGSRNQSLDDVAGGHRTVEKVFTRP